MAVSVSTGPVTLYKWSISQKLKKTLGGLKLAPANQRGQTGDETANKKTDALIGS